MHYHEGAIEHVELAALDVEHGQALFDRNGAQRRQQVSRGSAAVTA
ncbi:hypothetical protein [Immundisolibacter sp.]|nr:hypothetical protein [Immundisolibacter sp.]